MRVAKEITEKKAKFALEYWQKNGDEGSGRQLDETIKKRFGTGLGLRRLYELRKEAAGAPEAPAPTPPDADVQAAAPSADKKCPKCGETKNVEKDFGFRMMNGKQKPQAWCRECRAGASKTKPFQPKMAARRAVNEVAQEPKNEAMKVHETVTEEQMRGELQTPPAVLAAAASLLDEMRKHRVEAVNLHSSGSTSIKLLRSEEAQVHFGGRRANDPNATVSMPN